MRPRLEIKERAKFQFRQRYGLCVGAALLFTLLLGETGNFSFTQSSFRYDGPQLPIEVIHIIWGITAVVFLLSAFVGGPITVGYSRFSSCIYLGVGTDIGDMFRSGFGNYWRSVGGMLWMRLFIFLWSMLFVIPGIVKTYAYFATPYILAEFPYVRPTEALKISMRMTYGYKGDIFIMGLSFIGWYLLSALTFGLLGILYVNPYYYTSMAGMYQELKMNSLYRGTVTYEELTGYPMPQGEISPS